MIVAKPVDLGEESMDELLGVPPLVELARIKDMCAPPPRILRGSVIHGIHGRRVAPGGRCSKHRVNCAVLPT
jgi:hypothetical protein